MEVSFRTDVSIMSEKASKLSLFAEDYDSIREQVRQAATSMGAAYDSADNRSFTAHIEEFCSELKFMSDKLRTASEIIKQQSSMYTSREEHNTSVASRLP